MTRVLVVLPTASYRTHDFVLAADSLGVELAVASEEDPPLDLGDRFVRIDCANPEAAATAIIELADHTPIDAVVAADDAGVVTAALASERLGLTHHPPSAAAATRDKLEMRRMLGQAEVPQPAFAPVEAGTVPPAALAFPIVVKPRTATASIGVLRVDTREDWDEATGRVAAIAAGMGETGPLLAENYIGGEEMAVEAMVVDGRVSILAVFDKPDTPPGPTFPETLLVTPSQQAPAVREEVERVVTAGVTALGLRHGPVHAEVIVDGDERVHLLEIAARSIGGLCGRSLRFGLTGTSLEELILATALGRGLDAHRQPRASGVMMLPVPRSGRLVGVSGVEQARSVEGITEIDITIPPGTRVQALPEGGRYVGFIFGVGPTPDATAELIRTAAAHLRITIED